MNLAACPSACPSASSKPQPPQPNPKCSMGHRDNRAATLVTFPYQFTPVVLNFLSAYSRNQAGKGVIREAEVLIKCWFVMADANTWSLTVP